MVLVAQICFVENLLRLALHGSNIVLIVERVFMTREQNCKPCIDNLYCYKYSRIRKSCPKNNSGDDEIKPAFEESSPSIFQQTKDDKQHGEQAEARKGQANKVAETKLISTHQLDVEIERSITEAMCKQEDTA